MAEQVDRRRLRSFLADWGTETRFGANEIAPSHTRRGVLSAETTRDIARMLPVTPATGPTGSKVPSEIASEERDDGPRKSRRAGMRWCITIPAGPNRYEDRDRSASNRRTASTLRASGAEPGGDHSLARTNRTRGCSISRSVHNISTTTMQSLARPALNSTFRAHDR
jgi:hypothetical protein